MIHLRAIAPAWALVGLIGCSMEPGGPDYARLGVRASDDRGLTTAMGCTTLPVLLGGRVLTRYDIGGRFDVIIDADFEIAQVRLEGVSDAAAYARAFSAASLRAGVVEELLVTTSSGTVTVLLTSECDP